MSLSELKIVINDIIDDYNLDIVLLLGIILFGLYTFFIAPVLFVNTTDAVIDGHLINLTSRASGQIMQSYIMKDQEVKKGDLLMEINPKEYQDELLKLETDKEVYKQKLRLITNAPLPEDMLVDENNPQMAQNNQNSKQVDPNVAKPPKFKQGEKDYTNYAKTYEPEDLAQKNIARKRTALGDTLQNMSDINQQSEKNQPVEINIPTPVIDKSKVAVAPDESVESVQKELKNIDSQEEEVKLRLSSTKIFAPQDGIISGVSIAAGDIVNPSDVVCTLIPKQVWVIARVNPSQLPKIQVGQSVRIKIPGYKRRSFKGSVSSVDTTAKVYQVKADEQITEVDADGQVIPKAEPAYQIKIEFVEDYSDFNLPPDTPVKAKIKVRTLIAKGF